MPHASGHLVVCRRYLEGEVYSGKIYKDSEVGVLRTFEVDLEDGNVMVWRHALDLRPFGMPGQLCMHVYIM